MGPAGPAAAPDDTAKDQLGTEALGLAARETRQLRAPDAVGKPEEVLDQRRVGCLTAGHVALQDDGRESVGGRVHRRRRGPRGRRRRLRPRSRFATAAHRTATTPPADPPSHRCGRRPRPRAPAAPRPRSRAERAAPRHRRTRHRAIRRAARCASGCRAGGGARGRAGGRRRAPWGGPGSSARRADDQVLSPLGAGSARAVEAPRPPLPDALLRDEREAEVRVASCCSTWWQRPPGRSSPARGRRARTAPPWAGSRRRVRAPRLEGGQDQDSAGPQDALEFPQPRFVGLLGQV